MTLVGVVTEGRDRWVARQGYRTRSGASRRVRAGHGRRGRPDAPPAPRRPAAPGRAGADGWRWTPEGFARETFESPQFDPRIYVVAVHELTGAYAGLARVWLGRGPRLGLVDTVREHRRRRFGQAMLAAVIAVLHEWGHSELAAEVDERNTPSMALLGGLGADRVGVTLELRRPVDTVHPLNGP